MAQKLQVSSGQIVAVGQILSVYPALATIRLRARDGYIKFFLAITRYSVVRNNVDNYLSFVSKITTMDSKG